jgi:hypothetical protein
MEHDFGCESVFSVKNPRKTPRIMQFEHVTSKTMRDRIGLPPREAEAGEEFEKFTVVGHSWLRESWVPISVFTE